ncbi:MAG: redox-sensing transcriptional repressor Rex [Thermoanaerobaculia bacterium]
MTEPQGPRRSGATESISELTTERLSVYLRCLTGLESLGVTTVSSHELARRYHLNSAQIRKDLANFGELGIRGVGYQVAQLKQHLIEALGLGQTRNLIIIGAGNLGMALADYRGFHESGFAILALLDKDPERIGSRSRTGVPVVSIDRLDEIVRVQNVEIAIITVPSVSAVEVYERILAAGIRAVLNFAPAQLAPQEGVKLRHVDLRINLEALSFFLKNAGNQDGQDP